MKLLYTCLLILFTLSSFELNAQVSISGGFAWSNEPFNPDGYAINADYSLPISKNNKWYFKPNVGYKNMKNYDDYLLAELQNQAIGLNATFGYKIVNKKHYELISYLGPSLRWNKFWGRLDNELLNIYTVGSGQRYFFALTPEKPENSLEMTRFGYALQIENQFKVGNQKISLVPFLEPDISFDPNSGGFYISFYLD